MHLFYTPDITPGSYQLPEEESKHAIRVLRLKQGDELFLVDGRGGFFKANIIDDSAKHCTVQVIAEEKQFQHPQNRISIAIAPTKNMDRMEWFFEKAVEIGIRELFLLQTSNSERTVVKTERLAKIGIAAMKQSLNAYLPVVHEMQSLKQFLLSAKTFSGQKFIAHCAQEEKQHLKNVYQPNSDALVLIGPEGDFSSAEIALARGEGFQPVSLGSSRLRTETAALYACTCLNMLNENY